MKFCRNFRKYFCENIFSVNLFESSYQLSIPDSKVQGANMGPNWVLAAPDGPHAGPMNRVIRDVIGQIEAWTEWLTVCNYFQCVFVEDSF